MRMHLGMGLGSRGLGGSIALTAYSILESASSGSTVGVLSVVNHPSGASGWTFTETADPDNKFAISGTNLNTSAALNYETATSHQITITASKSGQTSVVRTLTITVTNVLEVTLGTVALDSLTYAAATPSSGSITGKSSGSTLALVGSLPTGLTLDLTGLTWAWSGAGTPSSGSFTIRETHADGNNSPKDNTQSWTIGGIPAPALTRTSSAGAVPVTWDATNAVAGLFARLQMDNNSDFSSPEQDYTVLITGANMGDTDLLFPDFVQPSGTYYLRMRYERDDGINSDWSNTLTDTIVSASTVLTTSDGANKNQYATVSGTPAPTASATVHVH